jgi:hypothetical protein
MFTVKSHFMGSFKIGDNICYNLDILKLLYKHFDTVEIEQKKLLCKPITIMLVSIIEAVLYDFFCVRAKTHTIEGIPSIDDDRLQDIREKKLDELNLYIDQAKKHDVLKSQGKQIYDELHELRKIRNRIHIQNPKGIEPFDEHKLFIIPNKIRAEKTLEGLLKLMAQKYPRKNNLQGNMDFELPWEEHRH